MILGDNHNSIELWDYKSGDLVCKFSYEQDRTVTTVQLIYLKISNHIISLNYYISAESEHLYNVDIIDYIQFKQISQVAQNERNITDISITEDERYIIILYSLNVIKKIQISNTTNVRTLSLDFEETVTQLANYPCSQTGQDEGEVTDLIGISEHFIYYFCGPYPDKILAYTPFP